jgi:hypothetical protein
VSRVHPTHEPLAVTLAILALMGAFVLGAIIP